MKAYINNSVFIGREIMNWKIFMPAAALLLLVAADAVGQPARQNVRMVLWYSEIARPVDSSISVRPPERPPEHSPERTVEQTVEQRADTFISVPRRPVPVEADTTVVSRALRNNGAIVLSIDPYFRRVVFAIPSASVGIVRALPWVVSLMSWPEVVSDNDGTRQEIRAAGIPLPPIAGRGRANYSPARAATATGEGVVVGIFDIALPSKGNGAHAFRNIGTPSLIDFQGGKKHATHVAGIVAGRGRANGQHRGIAPAASLRAWSVFGSDGKFNAALPPATAARNYLDRDTMHISQNSWTIRPPKDNPCDAFGAYNGFCMEYDDLVRERGLTVVFSAGNHRCTCYEALCGRGGYRTVMAPATAKNIITVGAVERGGEMSTFSSYGGTADNRIVPQVVAPGVNVWSSVPWSSSTPAPQNGMDYAALSGTSMAAPAVSGGLALLVQSFKHVNAGALPEPALLKALLLNNARDLGRPGPDVEYGYGMADINAASEAIVEARHIGGISTTGCACQHTIEVAAGCILKVMLCYSDIPAAATTGVGRTLVNDLDLVLTAPDGTEYLPLKLNPSYMTLPAQPGVIDHDNVEQVVVTNPMPGRWRITVKGTSVTGAQSYAVTWTRACLTPGTSTNGRANNYSGSGR
jgi:subtilisin family serine protease